MVGLTRRGAFALAGAATLVAGGTAAAESAAPPTLDELLRKPRLRGVAVSADGRRLALLQDTGDGDKRAASVILVDAENLAAPPKLIQVGPFDVDGIVWASNERLLIWVEVERAAAYTPIGSILARDIPYTLRRAFSISADGLSTAMLFGQSKELQESNFDLGHVIDLLPDDPAHVLMTAWDWNRGCMALHRVDVATGQNEVVERGGYNTDTWFTHDGTPVVRVDSDSRGTVSLYARATGETNWKLFRKIRRNEWDKYDFDFIGVTDKPDEGLVATRTEADKTKVVRKFDLRAMTVGDVVASRPDRDVDDWLIDEHRRFFAARYTADRTEYDFADPTFAPHFRGMNRFFQGECNLDVVDFDQARNRFVIRVTGPTEAGGYYFYDRQARHFEPLGAAKPWLAGRLAPMQMLDVKTRDGMTIRAYLTTPLKAGPAPLVVMPHGGPEARDSYEYDTWVQALAAAGYMVLQPNFRGSGGYGADFADAGHRHWGDAMQADVEDAVAQVLAAGRADPKRVAIMGASYGGYAALMGAVRKPDLYRAVISIAGVSDLVEMMNWERKGEGDDSPAYKYWLRQIGDPKADAGALNAASPRQQASAFSAPVLLLHGDKDGIVDPKQSKIMADALRKAGKSVDYAELKGAGHRNWDAKTLRTVLERSIAFLGKNLA